MKKQRTSKDRRNLKRQVLLSWAEKRTVLEEEGKNDRFSN